MKTLIRYTKLYGLFLAQYLKRLMEYRADFWIGLMGFLLFQASGILFLSLVFDQIPLLQGWSFAQLLFIYGFAQIPRGIDHLFCDNLWMLSGQIIVKGEFDKYLTRPISPLFHLISEVFQPDALGELIVGLAVLIVAAVQLGLTWGPLEWLGLGVLALLGSVIYTSLKLFFASFAFWLKYAQAIVYFAYTFSDFAKFPLPIFPPLLRGFLMFVLPFAFTAFVPAEWALGLTDFWPALGATAAAAGVSAFLAGLMWKGGLRAYESAGS